jgi:hypothetical protein
MTCRSRTWSLSKLADFLVAEGVVDDISHEGLRALLREEGVTFQRLKTWKAGHRWEHGLRGMPPGAGGEGGGTQVFRWRARLG